MSSRSLPTSSSSLQLASILVARFLRSNNYTQTLDAFIREAGLPPDAGQVSGRAGSRSVDGWTIEGVIEEKKAFDQSLKFERYGEGDDGQEEKWSVPAPSKPTIIQTPSPSNLLSVSVEPWQRSRGADGEEEETAAVSPYIVATGADRRLNLFKTADGHDIATSFSGLSDSPILSHASVWDGKYHLITNMSGQLLLLRDSQILDRRKDHTKYAVKVVTYEVKDEGEGPSCNVWIATAGWDAKILIYRMTITPEGSISIGDPVASIRLATNPESILFVRSTEESGDLMLLASRRDSTFLYFYDLEPPSTAAGLEGNKPHECRLLGKQNLAPHSQAWVTFSPSCLALSPHDPGLLAVATSTLPHMKVMIVRLLFPSKESISGITVALESASLAEPEPQTQASQARAELALQNREDAAILIQANTLAPQTAYSTPQVVWRPDGSGLWVNGDDGVIRGVEAKTGKVVATLKDGHEVGSKVRSIWAGWVTGNGKEEGQKREEWVLSGGFDKRLIVWKV
ncbi:hypothetical protein VTN00DRAFT_7905 [Thermoascus crustaceus]|uniref:uncharacterized protein n=1 Tax=Thermoascus crustaceus TaxID=5088 RepID=UPI00374431F1